MVGTDVLIAPAFPSNTARSGVLFPIVYSLAENNGSEPNPETRRRLGAFLMMTSMELQKTLKHSRPTLLRPQRSERPRRLIKTFYYWYFANNAREFGNCVVT